MSDSAAGDIILIGALAALGYAAYKILQPVEQAAGAVAGAVGQVATNVAAGVGAAETGVANAYVWATSNSVVPSGNVIMPNGTVVPVSQLAVTFQAGTGGVFNYGGAQYYIAQNPTGGPAYDTQGNYHAALIGNAPAAVNYSAAPGSIAPVPANQPINPSTGVPFSTDPTQAGYYDTSQVTG